MIPDGFASARTSSSSKTTSAAGASSVGHQRRRAHGELEGEGDARFGEVQQRGDVADRHSRKGRGGRRPGSFVARRRRRRQRPEAQLEDPLTQGLLGPLGPLQEPLCGLDRLGRECSNSRSSSSRRRRRRAGGRGRARRGTRAERSAAAAGLGVGRRGPPGLGGDKVRATGPEVAGEDPRADAARAAGGALPVGGEAGLRARSRPSLSALPLMPRRQRRGAIAGRVADARRRIWRSLATTAAGAPGASAVPLPLGPAKADLQLMHRLASAAPLAPRRRDERVRA